MIKGYEIEILENGKSIDFLVNEFLTKQEAINFLKTYELEEKQTARIREIKI